MNLAELHGIQGEIEALQYRLYDLKEAVIERNENGQNENLSVLITSIYGIEKKLNALKLERGILEKAGMKNIEVFLEDLFTKISESSNIPKEVLIDTRKKRNREVVQARQVHLFLLVLSTDFSLKNIGNMYYGKDHATVLHSKKTVSNLLETSLSFREMYAPAIIYVVRAMDGDIPKHKMSDGLKKFINEYTF